METMMTAQVTAVQVIDQAFSRALKAAPAYATRNHYAAVAADITSPNFMRERSLVAMLRALGDYAEQHQHRFGAPLARDSFLGEQWLVMLRGFLALLNGDLGRLDGGALYAAAMDVYTWAGFEGEL